MSVNRPDETSDTGLSPADIAAIDHLAEEGFDPSQLDGLEGEARARAQAAQSLLSSLGAYPDADFADDDRTTLVHATMARIRRGEAMQQDRMRLQPTEVAGRGSRMRFRLAEFGAVAAVAAMVAGAAVPMAHMAKDRAVSFGTHNNLTKLHAGVTAWTDATNGHLPTTAASTGVANLMGDDVRQLDMSFVSPALLHNPRRPGMGRYGFSFVILPATGANIHIPTLVLIGDRNPALKGLLQGKPFTEAMAHRKFARRLTDHPAILFLDGRVINATNGTVQGDHIWDVEDKDKWSGDVLLAH